MKLLKPFLNGTTLQGLLFNMGLATIGWIVVCVVFTIPRLMGQQPLPSPQLVVPCKVVSVYDGDTPTVTISFVMRIRLKDCWAPELSGLERVRGLASKEKLKELVLSKDGILAIPLYDDLGKSTSLSRIVGVLHVDGKNINEEMVRLGYATKEKTQ